MVQRFSRALIQSIEVVNLYFHTCISFSPVNTYSQDLNMGILKQWYSSILTYLQIDSIFSANAHNRKILPGNCIYIIKINGCGEVTYCEGSTFS